MDLLMTADLNKSQLVLGVNDVTKGLEDDTLKAVIIAKEDVKHILIQHFPTMCRWRSVPLVTLPPGSSDSLKTQLGLKSLVVMAFSRSSELSVVDSLASLFPPDMKLSDEWLSYREASVEHQDATRKRPLGKRQRPSRAAKRSKSLDTSRAIDTS